MASASARQLINTQTLPTNKLLFPASQPTSSTLAFTTNANDGNILNHSLKLASLSTGHRNLAVAVKASSGKGGIDEGVSLGTMKLPTDIDIPRFETLLFQWANSLCQGAQLPLPVPLKVDKIEGGIRLGFVEIDDGQSQVPVYIDCLILSGNKPPVFVATRNGDRKDKVPPGEPRIMKSLLVALKKSVEIARV